MPSSWSSITPLLSIKRAFSSHRNKKKEGRSSPSPPSISAPLPIQFSSPPSNAPRFSRRDDNLRTRKYLNSTPTPSLVSPTVPPRRSQHQSIVTPPTVPPRPTRSPSPHLQRKTVRATQQWPSSSTLLEWMQPSLTGGRRREERVRTRTLSENNPTPSRSSFYSSDSILLPIRTKSSMEIDKRSTTERVADWIRSKSRERVDGEEWKRTSSERWKNRRAPPLSSHSRSIDNLAYSMPAAAGCSNCMTKYSLMNREDGCSGCAMSFCKKCVQWKAVVPNLSSKPLSVCRACFDRIEKENKAKEPSKYTITSTPLYPSVSSSPSSSSHPTSYFPSRQSHSSHSSSSSFTPPPPYSQTAPSQHQEYSQNPSHHSYSSPSSQPPSSSIYPSNLVSPWWNQTDLPPPSMRAEYGRGVVQPLSLIRGMAPPAAAAASTTRQQPAAEEKRDELSEMEERAKKLRDDAQAPAPSLNSLEERLAALRGCDVELVRNPRSYFMDNGKSQPRGDTVHSLMEEARSMAVLEERNDPDRLLEERAKKLIERKEEEKKEEEDEQNRLSVVPSVASRMSEYSEATKEELADIDRVMAEAAVRVEQAEGRVERERKEEKEREGDVKREMGEANKLAAQLSLDVQKVNAELAGFWEKENEKRGKPRKDSSSEGELDDETIASIVREAEMAPDEPIAEKKSINPSESSPEKKKGLFGRMFKK